MAAWFLVLSLCSLAPALVAAGGTGTPPRGWNSYDSFNWIIGEQAFLDNCRYMAANMPTYTYCVVDFLWYQDLQSSAFSLDAYGRPQPSLDRWPSTRGVGFKPIADAVHAMGLQFGIHIMRGISKAAVDRRTPVLGTNVTAADIAVPSQSCPWNSQFMSVDATSAGGKAFYASLYQQYADWGVDFIKNDCVFGVNYLYDQIRVQSDVIQDIYRTTGHRIVYSLSPGDTQGGLSGSEEANAKEIFPLVNLYRVSDDDWDKWTYVAVHFDLAANFAAAGLIGEPGLLGGASWPDLDMLPFGWITDPGSTRGPYRNTSLTPDEQRSQMTLWVVARSPLMFGGDMRHMDAFTLSLLTNAEVLAVNSFSSGNRQILSQGAWRVWSAYNSTAAGLTTYAAFFNTGDTPASLTLPVTAFHVPGNACMLRDLWAQADKGTVTQLAVTLPAHGCALYALRGCA